MTPPIAAPRLAATILLLRDDPFEVLMVRRHEKQAFASALVFPGGTVDEADRAEAWLDLVEGHGELDPEQRALRIAGFRETFEETAVFLARGADGAGLPAPGGPEVPFIELVRASGGRLFLPELVHFGHWITPEGAPKRFDTHFYLCRAAPDQVAVCDGCEAVDLEWARPNEILARAAAGERSILFPTRMNMRLLAQTTSADEAIAEARARPVVTVLPRVEKRAGGVAVVIPEGAGYGETENFLPAGT